MCLALIITYLNLSLLSLSPIQQLLYEGALWFHDFEPKNKNKSLFNDLGESSSILGLYIVTELASFFPCFVVCKINMILSNFYFGWLQFQESPSITKPEYPTHTLDVLCLVLTRLIFLFVL